MSDHFHVLVRNVSPAFYEAQRTNSIVWPYTQVKLLKPLNAEIEVESAQMKNSLWAHILQPSVRSEALNIRFTKFISQNQNKVAVKLWG